jgi:hypothetical protein
MNVKEAMKQLVERCSKWQHGDLIGSSALVRSFTTADDGSERGRRVVSLALQKLVKSGYLTVEGKTRAAAYFRGTGGAPKMRVSKPGLAKTSAKWPKQKSASKKLIKNSLTPEHLDAVLAAIEAKQEGILAAELYRLPCGKDIAKAAARALVTSGAVLVQGERVKTRYVLR